MIIDAPGIIQIYPEVILYIASLAFLFFYLNYAVKAFYRNYRMKSLIRKDGTLKLHANLANLNLFENIISILIWGVFALISMVMLNIPKEGISLVTAGLATGVGFAMKDILNNFFYGIQLMAGRVHIGDIIECDGVRGSVESITYQSTQILTGDGCVMAFLNSDLFRKNFKNLTKNHDYELVIIPVGVAYGCNIENVRQIILQAVAPLDVKDENGRDVVSKKRDVTVDLQNFGDNSVDLAVKQLVLVDKEFSYKAQARELIYNALNDNKIEIPFPQRDIYIRQMPTDK
jgi:small-conductance mechanosensitive channel